MTRGIEDMLNLPHLDELMKQDDPAIFDEGPSENLGFEFVPDTVTATQDVDAVDHSKSMDEVYKETLDHSRNLMDLAFNVDDRARRGVLEIAVSMYKNAIDAKNSKRDMQLKSMKLMIDQQKMNLEERKFRTEQGEEIIESKATMVEDRNELIRQFREQGEKEKNSK